MGSCEHALVSYLFQINKIDLNPLSIDLKVSLFIQFDMNGKLLLNCKVMFSSLSILSVEKQKTKTSKPACSQPVWVP